MSSMPLPWLCIWGGNLGATQRFTPPSFPSHLCAGHVPLHKIPENMQKQLEWCNEVRRRLARQLVVGAAGRGRAREGGSPKCGPASNGKLSSGRKHAGHACWEPSTPARHACVPAGSSAALAPHPPHPPAPTHACRHRSTPWAPSPPTSPRGTTTSPRPLALPPSAAWVSGAACAQGQPTWSNLTNVPLTPTLTQLPATKHSSPGSRFLLPMRLHDPGCLPPPQAPRCCAT